MVNSFVSAGCGMDVTWALLLALALVLTLALLLSDVAFVGL